MEADPFTLLTMKSPQSAMRGIRSQVDNWLFNSWAKNKKGIMYILFFTSMSGVYLKLIELTRVLITILHVGL